MTQLNDIFSARILISRATGYPDYLPRVYEDITSGIMNVDIKSGVDFYEGPWQQPDTGQFTIVTRNPNLDPKINPNIRYNSVIEFLDSRIDPDDIDYCVFFRGYVTDINVEYVRNDNPIITITGTDALGLLQRMLITPEMEQEVIEYGGSEGYTFQEFTSIEGIQLTVGLFALFNFVAGETFIGGSLEGATQPSYRPARLFPKAGENILEIMTRYAQTNLDLISITPDYNGIDSININPFVKYNPAYWSPQQDPALEYPTYQFSSDPADGRPYESILVDNGYTRVTNQLEFSNEYRTVVAGVPESTNESFGTYTYEESVNDWGITKSSVETCFPESKANETEMERYSRDIFQIVAFPTEQIQNITFNNGRNEDIESGYTYSDFQIRQFIRIKHQLNNTETIDRFYDIAGITHSISPNEWTMGFNFKPSEQELAFTYQGEAPTIQMNALTGDTNFNFTATITDYATENIVVALWQLGAFYPLPDIDTNYDAAYGNDFYGPNTTTRYKDHQLRDGLTQTWNFDDDGILATPYGAGYWYVIPYITLTNGWVIAPSVQLTVGAPVPIADFTWSQDVTSNFGAVTFTDQSRNNEIGEPNSYFWEFGDGTTSSEQNPVHIYPAPLGGTEFDVSLTVFARFGGGTNKKTETITLEEPVMTANYTFTQERQVVTFTNTSTNVGFEMPDAYFWEFGDGTTSSEKNPVHTFPADDNETLSFSVKLTVKNVFETTTSVTKSVEVVALNASGTLPIRYIQLRQGNLYGLLPSERGPETFQTGIASNISKFKARTSGTKANLSYQKPIGNIQNVNAIFRSYQNSSLQTDPNSNFTSAYGNGLEPDWITKTSASDWKIIIDLQTPTQFIKDIVAEFSGNIFGTQYSTIGAYDIYATTHTGTLSDPNSVTWFKIGSFEPGYNGFQSDGSRLGIEETMESIRPMPMNIPYFDYTFNNLTATFTSYETADSYAWSFGDGTTSTLKNPVKTFPARGTYNVTLAVTNGGIVTRTTTEPVIVKSLVNFDVRHVKLVQNLHTGTGPFDTPTILLANAKIGPISLPVGFNKYSVTDFQYEDYPLEFYWSTNNSDQGGSFSNTPVDITSSSAAADTGGIVISNKLLTEPQQFPGGTFGVGGRVKSLDASNRTQWTAVIDLQKAHKGIEDFTINARRDYRNGTNNDPGANPGVTYSVYFTNDTSATIDPNTVTWTKIGDITPIDLPTPKNANYQLGKEFPVVLT